MSESQMSRRASVWVLPLETGGCGASLQSIFALLAPGYAGQLRREGVSFARSPRHADIVLIAGPLTLAAREPVERLLAGVPQPRALVAVGDCAIDGCVFAGSPAVTAQPADVLDVHIEVGGCPPDPSSILAAIVEAKHLLAGDDLGEETAEDAASEDAEGEDAASEDAEGEDAEGEEVGAEGEEDALNSAEAGDEVDDLAGEADDEAAAGAPAGEGEEA